MIIKTQERINYAKYCNKGDSFSLTISNGNGSEMILTEKLAVSKTIDYYAIFRFAEEDGTCKGFHLCGIFGNTEEIPRELQSAINFEDLSGIQKDNFIKSSGLVVVRQ